MPLILTRHDERTGQPLFDYFVTRIADSEGDYAGINEDGTITRYSIVMTITKRHEVK